MALDPNALQAATEAFTAAREEGTPIIDTFPAIILAYLQHAGEAEPVAWQHRGPRGGWVTTDERTKWSERPLFAAPHPHQVPEGLTEDQLAAAIGAALDATVRDGTKIVDWLGFNAADAVDLGTESATFEAFSKLDVVREQQYNAVARAVLAPVIRAAMIAASPSKQASASADQGGE